MKNKFLALLLALMLIAAPALALPSPSDDFYILDEANVISNSTEEYIIYNNDQLYDACGAQIVFVTVDNTEGEAIDDYAYDLFNEWGIGDSSKDNGFLVLMAIDDDNYYALPGTGLERAISAGTVKDLLDTYLEPDFAKKDYDAGAKALFDALFDEVCDASSVALTAGMPAGITSAAQQKTEPSAPKQTRNEDVRSDKDGGGISIGAIILIVIILLIIFGGRKRRTYRRTHVPPHIPPHAPHVPPTPPRRPIIIPRINIGPRPGPGPRPNVNRSRTSHFGGGGGSTRGGGAGRSFGGGRSGGFSRGGRSGGGGGSRGGGAGRGR